MVVLFHLETISTALAGAPQTVQRVAGYGSSTVGLFFILSGFILTYGYLGGGRPLDRPAFWVARISRIYPVYVLGLLVAAPLTFQTPIADGTRGLARLVLGAITAPTLTQAWLPTTAVVWNAPGWSLSVEAFFYLVFPFAAPVLMRASTRTAVAALVLAWIACLIPPLVHGAIFPDLLADGAEPWARVVKFNPLLRFPEFAAGILLARIFLTRQSQSTFKRSHGFERLHSLAWLALLLAIWLLGPTIPFLLSNNGIFDPLFAALVYTLAGGGGVLGRVLSLKSTVLLGEASYSVYVLHEPVLEWLNHFNDLGLLPADAFARWWFIPAYCAAILGLSFVSFAVVERPCRAWWRGKRRRSTRSALQAV